MRQIFYILRINNCEICVYEKEEPLANLRLYISHSLLSRRIIMQVDHKLRQDAI